MSRQSTFRWGLLLVSAFACGLIFYPFLMEILLASFFAFALAPVTRRLSQHRYFGRKGWVAVTILGLVLAIVIPIILLGVSTFNLIAEFTSEGFQNSDIYRDLIAARDFLLGWARQIMDTFNISEHISGRFNLTRMANQFVSGTGQKIVAASGGAAARIPDFVLSLLIFCATLYLFLAEGKKIRHMLTKNQFMPHSDLDRLITIFQKSCYTTLVASVIVGFTQASTVAIGSALLKANHVLLIFLMTFIFSFIPVIGAAPVAFFMAFLSVIKGDSGIAIGYVVLGIIAGTMDNVIRPLLVRGEGEVNALVMLIAIIGAIMIFGIPGLFLGPMFVSVAVQVFQIFFVQEKTTTQDVIK